MGGLIVHAICAMPKIVLPWKLQDRKIPGLLSEFMIPRRNVGGQLWIRYGENLQGYHADGPRCEQNTSSRCADLPPASAQKHISAKARQHCQAQRQRHIKAVGAATDI